MPTLEIFDWQRIATTYSDNDGIVDLGFLSPGEYSMVETMPPAGYTSNPNTCIVRVQANGIVTINNAAPNAFHVINYPLLLHDLLIRISQLGIRQAPIKRPVYIKHAA